MKLTLACCSAAAALGIGGLGAVRSEATPEPVCNPTESQAECRVVSAECVDGACVLTCESADGRTCRVEIECSGCQACC